ncbi:hypothetical protein FNV43_RR20984 [Rhamnella rubrinervis]|uniref:Uncharacterized protein n=1 Tax=Rhamnella rubrinervis TaxID=2594499 RepID=A0A8K0GV22_9ROSA|nr:hypothetical protein FNV43_RR20984 [Rhamnella rubrinervis]
MSALPIIVKRIHQVLDCSPADREREGFRPSVRRADVAKLPSYLDYGEAYSKSRIRARSDMRPRPFATCVGSSTERVWLVESAEDA